MVGGAEYRFVSWVRTGVGALLEGEARTVTIDLGAAGTVPRTLAQLGPGDVTGLDPRAIVRTVPASGTTDFEPNLFVSVELAHPAIPWMLSPPAPKPTPWIALVVVEVESGVSITTDGGRQVLTIGSPATVALPDLEQAWAWAHAQENNVEGAPLDTAALTTSRGNAKSRLICPRRLKPRTSYLACIVPTFAAGVSAALGTPATNQTLAWTGSESSVRLPVYASWRFATGDAGDFVSLVKRLQPEVLDASVGHRQIDISDPRWGMPAQPGAMLDVAGALYSSKWHPVPSPAADVIGQRIGEQLDRAAHPPANAAPIFAPPFYGAAASRAESMQAAPPWQRTLNEDVAERIAAGIGAHVVREHIDELVDAAWRAVGDTEAINRLLRHAELGATVTQRLGDKHLSTIATDGELLAVARPLLARVRSEQSGPTVAASLIKSAMPNAALTGSFRRLGRARGTIALRAKVTTGMIAERAATHQIVAAPAKELATGAASFDAVCLAANEAIRLADATPEAVATSAQDWRDRIAPHAPHPPHAPVPHPHAPLLRALPDAESRVTPPLVSDELPTRVHLDEFAAAAREHQQYITQHLTKISLPPFPVPVHLGRLRVRISEQWTAKAGLLPILEARIEGVEPVTGFQPVIPKPVLERPMIEAVQALSPDLVMPGVSAVSPNRMAIAETNASFARALLVGANEELARELLWRRYPAALGHTWLRSFWGRVEPGSDGLPRAIPDIPPIEEWPPNGPDVEPAQLVLLVRGDVLHRYPNALVYAAEAKWQGIFRVVGGGDPLFPVVATTLGPDIALFGFNLSIAKARGTDTPAGHPGYYFVVAEHPHEPRFGLAATTSPGVSVWQNVAWADIDPQRDLRAEHLRIDGPLAQRVFAGDDLRWGSDAAQLAAITVRRVTRVAMHASRLV